MGEEEFNQQLRKAFQELQQQILESREKQKNAVITKAAMKQNIRVAEIVKAQLQQLPEDEEDSTRSVYRIVGRAFFQETIPFEIRRQEADIRLCNERLALVDKQKEYLETKIAESEKNLRELIQTKRQQQQT